MCDRIIERCFPEQRAFVLDPWRLKSALCPRRSGKTYACAASICVTALGKPKSNILYVTLTGGQAFSNLWPILQEFNDEFELKARFNTTKLLISLPNGSKVRLAGAQTIQEVEKLRGAGYDLVIIDEGKSFTDRVFDYLLEEVIVPATIDRLGTISMIGTPGNVLAGRFYEHTPFVLGTLLELTESRAPVVRPYAKRTSWGRKRFNCSFHHWTPEHNVRAPHIWEEYQRVKDSYGYTDADAHYQREYLGYWCQSDSLSVYRYDTVRNGYDADGEGPFGLPAGHDWNFILGLDLGFHDDTAVVVAAYSPTHDKLYHVYDKSIPHLTFDNIEKLVADTKAMFPPMHGCVADTGGLGKTIVESLAERGHPFHTAEKREKYDHIELVNADLLSGRVKVLRESVLANQMSLLQWEDDTYKREDKRTPNHACDAFLYLWRYALHHFWRPHSKKPARGSDEWFEQWDLECAEKAARGVSSNASEPRFDTGSNYRLADE